MAYLYIFAIRPNEEVNRAAQPIPIIDRCVYLRQRDFFDKRGARPWRYAQGASFFAGGFAVSY